MTISAMPFALRWQLQDLSSPGFAPKNGYMNRREFLQGTAAAVTMSAMGNYAVEFADQKEDVKVGETG